MLIGKSLIHGPFSIAMFDYRRVCLGTFGSQVDFAQGAYGKEDIKGYDKASVNVAIGEKCQS